MSHSVDHEFEPTASLAALEGRATLLRRLRAFFDGRGFVEVETPLLAREIIPELHIEPITSEPPSADGRAGWFLQASPELHMKRLLAAGATAIYQVTRSFRAGERGELHNPEFTIVEWYRVGDDMQAGMNLLDELAQALLGAPPAARTSYAEAFERHVGICPHTSALEDLQLAAGGWGRASGGWGRATASPQFPDDVAARPKLEHGHLGDSVTDRDELLNLLLATRVEPQLGRERPEILYHYPASQSSLARVARSPAGYDVAERFELYYHGIELANGFHELTDAAEQRRRFELVNAARTAAGRRTLPIPESLLAALERGLPDCTGCALGFDRLVMVALGATSIRDVMPFTTR